MVGVFGRVSRERKGRYDHDIAYACMKLSINLNYPGNFKSLHNGNKNLREAAFTSIPVIKPKKQ